MVGEMIGSIETMNCIETLDELGGLPDENMTRSLIQIAVFMTQQIINDMHFETTLECDGDRYARQI